MDKEMNSFEIDLNSIINEKRFNPRYFHFLKSRDSFLKKMKIKFIDLGNKDYFVGILVTSHVWKTIGWSSIIYLAAMSSIDPALYESARIDGANRLQMAWHITLPSIMFVIVIMFLLEIGNLLEAGFEQILLLYSPSVYKVADIIDTFVYREGLLALKYSFAAAVGLFKAVIAFFLLYTANRLANRLGQTGLW